MTVAEEVRTATGLVTLMLGRDGCFLSVDGLPQRRISEEEAADAIREIGARSRASTL